MLTHAEFLWGLKRGKELRRRVALASRTAKGKDSEDFLARPKQPDFDEVHD